MASLPRVVEIFEPDVERQLRALRRLLDAPMPPRRPAAWSDPIDPIDDATPEDFAPPADSLVQHSCATSKPRGRRKAVRHGTP